MSRTELVKNNIPSFLKLNLINEMLCMIPMMQMIVEIIAKRTNTGRARKNSIIRIGIAPLLRYVDNDMAKNSSIGMIIDVKTMISI